MVSAEQRFISISVVKCRDELGRLVLKAKVHGGSFLYASIGLNGGCNMIARRLVGKYVLVTARVNGSIIGFVTKVKARKKTAIAVAIPTRFRGLFARGSVVEVRLRPIDGDGHGSK